MLRVCEQPRQGRRCKRYMQALSRKKLEPASVLLEGDGDFSCQSSLGSTAREGGHPHALVVTVLRIEQDEIFREIVMWL